MMEVIKQKSNFLYKGDPLGEPLYNFFNPIAEKGPYKICSENYTDERKKKLYTLYQNKNVLGYFYSVKEAKEFLK